MYSRIEVVEVFSGRTSGISFFSKETIYPMRGRKNRQNQIRSAVGSALIEFTKLIPTSSFIQDPEHPAHN